MSQRSGRPASGVWTLALAAMWIAIAIPSAALAERAWVRGDVRLNVRSGPGTQYRILAGVGTGDAVTVVARESRWTKVRLEDGKQGWVPVGYLAPEPPPTVRLDQVEQELGQVSDRLESANAEVESLREQNDALRSSDGVQRAEIDSLTLENMELRAGARWPEWITGAAILATGMLVGALLHRNSSRRPASRIRL